MTQKVKFYTDLQLGILKFVGDIGIDELTNLLIFCYESDEFTSLRHTILDFRNCNFDFEAVGIAQAIQVVQKYRQKNSLVKTALLDSQPKVTALTTLFQVNLNIPKKIIFIYGSPDTVIAEFFLPITAEKYEELYNSI